jgi:hypothetical protein
MQESLLSVSKNNLAKRPDETRNAPPLCARLNLVQHSPEIQAMLAQDVVD